MKLMRLVCAAIVLQTCLTWSEAQGLDDTGMSIDQAILEAYHSSNASQQMNDPSVLRVQLDMLFLADVWHAMMRTPGSDANSTIRNRRKAIRNQSQIWPNAEVPYTLAASFDQRETDVLREAMNDYHTYTCVRFRQAMPGDRDYVRIVDSRGCSSFVGRQGSVQELSLSLQCRRKGVIIHELGHAIGLIHEHSRPDRDQYVSIKSDNIQSDYSYDFEKFSNFDVDVGGIPYDYESIMHYGRYAASRNRQIVIETRNISYQNIIGQRHGLSFRDIKIVNKMYLCAERSRCGMKTCPGEGFIGGDCRCWCPSGRTNIAAVQCPEVECGGNLVGSGTIRSPNFPGAYPNNANCMWMLRPSSADGEIFLEIRRFSTDSCCGFLRIFHSSGQQLLLSGEIQPRNLSLGTSANVSFTSNGSATRAGFEIAFSTTRRIAGTCSFGWHANGDSCYLITTPNPWVAVKQECSRTFNASLVDIRNTMEETSIYDFLNSRGVDRAWIGLNDMRAEGQWVWDSGEPVTYVNWAAGEPNDVRGNEDCVEVLATHRRGWNDNQCDQRFPGVCKRPKGQRDACGGTLVGSGTIQSPNFPRIYPHNVHCVWTLQTSTVAAGISLEIRHFSTEPCCDFVRISDTSGQQLSLSGQQQRRIVVVGSPATVSFTTDSSVDSTGFEIFFNTTSISSGDTCGGTLVGSGTIQSPNFPRSYPHDVRCVWTLQPSTVAAGISLEIRHFSTETCCDFVRISDTSGQQLSLSGEKQSQIIFVRPPATVYFSTDSSVNSTGFDIVFNTTSILPECTLGWTISGDFCYRVTQQNTWSGAKQECLTMNAFFVDIRNFKEQISVYEILNSQGVDRAWIGLNDMRTEGQWVWDSGEPVTYVNWAAGEPNDVRGNEDCVEVLATHRRGWNDNQCNQRFPGVCKKPKGRV